MSANPYQFIFAVYKIQGKAVKDPVYTGYDTEHFSTIFKNFNVRMTGVQCKQGDGGPLLYEKGQKSIKPFTKADICCKKNARYKIYSQYMIKYIEGSHGEILEL